MFQKTTRLKKMFVHELIAVLVIIAFLEIGLRYAPYVIPLPLLQGFEAELRSDIASKRGLETASDSITLKASLFPIEIKTFQPFTEVEKRTTEDDAVKLVTMDAQGFCNPPENPYENTTIDLIILGDSFTWCTSVLPEHTWGLMLGKKLGLDVYNLGQGGLGLYEEFATLDYFGLDKNPQIVVTGFYEGNDLRDSVLVTNRMKKKQQEGETVNDTNTYHCKVRPEVICTIHRNIQNSAIGKESYTYNLVSASLKLIVKELLNKTATRLEDGAGVYGDFRYQIQTETGSKIAVNQENADVDELGYAERVRRGELSFSVHDEALKSYANLSKEYGFEAVLLYIPTMYTTYLDHITFSDPRVRSLVDWFDKEQRAYLRKKSDELEIIFIDATDIMKQEAVNHRDADSLLYFASNLHPTPIGHEIIADYAMQTLSSR